MALIDMLLPHRPRNRAGKGAAQSNLCRPRVEVLENRECPALAAPGGLQLAAISPTQVKITWNDVAGETGYRIFYWNGAQTSIIGAVTANIKAFNVTGLQPNKVQWFTVEAFNLTTSARAAWASVTTPPQAISAATNLRITGTTLTQISLAWNNASGATGYRVYMWDGSQAQLLGTTTPTVPAFTARNLTPGTTYYFAVEAFNATNSATTDWISAKTLAQGITAPGNLKATTVNATTIGISWNDVAGETGYRVFRWNGVSGSNAVLIATLAANTTGFQATGLTAGTKYWFYVQAFNATNFANTDWVTGMTSGLPLQAPTQVAATAIAPTTIKVSWTEPANAVGYRIWVWSGYSWWLAGTVAKGTNNVTLTGLASHRTHWFVVQAFTANFAEVVNSNTVFANL